MKRRSFILAGSGIASGIVLPQAHAEEPCPPPTLSVGGGTSVSTACPAPSGLPSWVPPPGTFANISLNVAADVDPCPARGCAYSGASGQEAVFIVWDGGVYAPDFSQYGALVCHGGGHSAYSGNEVYAFDLSTRRWVRVGSPSVYPETATDGNGEFPDGQPFPPHTYAGVAYLSPSNGGGSKGSLLRFGFAGASVTQWVHRMPLETGPDTRGAWSRFTNLMPTLNGSYWAAAYDPTRNRYWVLSSGNSWASGFGHVAPNGSVVRLLNQGSNVDSTHVLAYCPQHDMLLQYARAATTLKIFGRSCNGSAGFTQLTIAGSGPAREDAGLEWSTAGGYFVAYSGDGSNRVYKLTPPASNPLTGAWTWSSQTLAGIGGASPIKASGYVAGQWNGHWSRFREVPALSTPGNPAFVYADGRTQPVQLWRL